MMRKFTLTLVMALAFGFGSFCQITATLPNVTASPNQSVAVDLNVTNFTNIMSFQFHIQLDPAVVSFQGVTNFTGSPAVITGNAGSNVLTLSWTSTSAVTWANGRLLTLNFLYSGNSSPLDFIPLQCEVVNSTLIPVHPNCTNGSVSPFMGNTAQASIDNVVSPLGLVAVPIKYTGFPTNVGSITQRITYDATKLTFANATGTGVFVSGVTATASNGIITVTYTSVPGANINMPGSQINLNFNYDMLVPTNLNFSTGCIVTTTAPVTNVPVTYNGGSVVPPSTITSFASLPTITNAVQDQFVYVPVTFTGMPSGVTSFNVNLTFDNPRVSYAGYIGAMYPVTVNNVGNSVSISYTNASGPNINGDFIFLRFRYNGVGTAQLNFASGCQFSVVSTPVNVGFTNGSISPAPALVNVTLGNVTATSPATNVEIPITFTGIPVGTDIGGVTMYVGFDASKLTYVSSSVPAGGLVQLQPSGNKLIITWTSGSYVITNGVPFIKLYFDYAASGNALASVTFLDECLLSDLIGATVPANWINGGVNNLFKLSGMLTYDPPSGVPITNAIVYIKDGPEPVPPATGPIPNIITQTTTDGTGYFEINLPNGSYYLYASTTMPWGGVDGSDIVQVRRYIANLSNGISTPLRLLAGDVSLDGIIDGTDLLAIRRRVANLTPNPAYLAPDWFFENPIVTISGANLNLNFTGLCSGDVNGSYPY